MKEQLFLCVNIVAAVLGTVYCELGPIVVTDKGAVQGVVDKTVWNKTYYSFWGIPYAKPPLNELRFMAPHEIDEWENIKDATRMKPMCPQRSPIDGRQGEEDCLYLNVFTPNLPTIHNTKRNLLPVMVWIHGGSFNLGSGHVNDQYPDFFMEENVIWVSFNYRLGVLGFLKSHTLNVSGNAGMKDQVQVLKWVRTNIHKFGGDCEKVTIIGWSAGAASVHYHMMSPMSQGLFHKTILQSGNAILPWAFTNQEETMSNSLCYDLFKKNCTENSLKLLQKENIGNIIEFFCHKYELSPGIFPFCMVPSVDDTFLTESPFTKIKNNALTQVPVLIGFNSNEGNVRHFYNENVVLDLETLNFLVSMICMSQSMDFFNKSFEDIESLILSHNNNLNTDDLNYRLIQADSECVAFHGTSESVNLLRRQFLSSDCNEMKVVSRFPIYFYRFSFDGSFNFVKLKEGVTTLPGASHGDEMGYMFRNKTLNDEFYNTDSKELITLKRMVKMWTNFAKTNNPTPEITELLPVKWLPVTRETKYMLDIDEELTMMQNFNESLVNFYSQFYNF